jgi:hypothetical protein
MKLEFECPEYIEGLIMLIADHVERIEWNRTQERYTAPTSNNGAQWSNDTFSMRAYYWGDDEAEQAKPNFKCGDIEVCWYKYLGRGMTINREVTEAEAVAMFDKCMASVRAMESDEL